MTDILDLPSAWRGKLRPASFGGARFHCDSNSRESGRRIVEHQFPKKDLPYAEDMGRMAREFSVRGYIVVFGYDSEGDVLKRRNYLDARDALMQRLETEGSSILQLPTQPPQLVVCTRYRMSEEDRAGGFCVFDMTFQEYGLDPVNTSPAADTARRDQQRRAGGRERRQRQPRAAQRHAERRRRRLADRRPAMKRADADEAAPLVDRMLANLVATVPARGRAGSDARTAIGDTRANAFKLCVADALGPPLIRCFTLTRLAGASLEQLEVVRQGVAAEATATLGGALVKNAGIRLCLATQARIVAAMTFRQPAGRRRAQAAAAAAVPGRRGNRRRRHGPGDVRGADRAARRHRQSPGGDGAAAAAHAQLPIL